MKPILIKNYKDYLKKLPADRKIRFQQFHEIIIKAAPSVEMGISYQMPCLKMEGIILYYASFEKHVSLFPYSKTIEVFGEQLKEFKTTKGTIQFSNLKPLPNRLITAIVKYRLRDHLTKMAEKKTKLKNNTFSSKKK
jgi:uncharacterized protein YdhG (YjbR/CyaY superfamily)